MMPKIGPKSRAAARAETHDLLKFIRDYVRVNRRAVPSLRDELHHANFGVEGQCNPSLDEADILIAIATMITTHRELEGC